MRIQLVSVVGKPPWEAKKEKKPDQKADNSGAPWEKKKNDDLAQKAVSAPWESRKMDKGSPPWSKKQDQTEVPPWHQKEKPEESTAQDLGSPPWQENDEADLGPPPWILQQQKNQTEKPAPLFEPQKIKQEPLFDSRKRSYTGTKQPRCEQRIDLKLISNNDIEFLCCMSSDDVSPL